MNRKMSAVLPLVLALSASLLACKDDGGGGGNPPPGGEQGYVTGRVVDTAGKPVSGVSVTVENTVLFSTVSSGSTDADGRYKIKVDPGSWRAFARMSREYNGRTYMIQFHPDNPDSFTGDGAVRNFEWRLRGKKPAPLTGTYGGLVTMGGDPNGVTIVELDTIEWTFTPVGPLIDGNPGQTLTARSGAPRTELYSKIEDIPIGRYSISARHLPPGEAPTDLKVRLYNIGEWGSSVVADFEPEANSCRNCMDLQFQKLE
jgi:hypothetical protein